MKEVKNMLWLLLGVLIGFGLGAWLLMWIYEWTKSTIASSPTLTILIALPVLGGGLVGGGWVAQRILERIDRAKRKRLKEEKNNQPFARKKKKR